jgi:hypothetical protein
MVCYFWNLKQFFNPPFGTSKSIKKHFNPMENEQYMPFQSEGGCALVFSISV